MLMWFWIFCFLFDESEKQKRMCKLVNYLVLFYGTKAGSDQLVGYKGVLDRARTGRRL